VVSLPPSSTFPHFVSGFLLVVILEAGHHEEAGNGLYVLGSLPK